MGIRVAKAIGHLNTDTSIFVEDFDQRMETLDCMPDHEVMELVRNHWEQEKVKYAHARSSVSVLTSLEFQQNVPIFNYIRRVYDAGDNDLGILVTNSDLHKLHRYGDLIDYYEHTAYCKQLNDDCAALVQELDVPLTILTDTWVLDGALYANESQAKQLSYRDVNVETINACKFCYGFEKKALMQELGVSEEIFIPYIPLSSFVALKSTGLLKEEVSYVTFAKSFKAVIMTYWS